MVKNKEKSPSRFHVAPGSVWSKLKKVTKGLSGEPWDDMWEETDQIRLIREYGGVFVNDHFVPLWNEIEGIKFMDGGYGSSKTTYEITRQLVKSMENDYHRCLYGRQKMTEATYLHSNILTEIRRNNWEDLFSYSDKPNGSKQIQCKATGNKFILFGCDEVESLKGLDNPTDILVDEINQISFESFGMLLTRLRGSGYKTQFIGCFNNCDVYEDHWIRKYIYGNTNPVEESERVLVEALRKVKIIKHHSTYLDNLFQNPDAYLQKLIIKAGGDQDKIDAYCKGDWGVSLESQPFYKMWNKKVHVKECIVGGWEGFNPNLPIHAIFDENVNPYLPCLLAQVVGKTVYFIDEIAAENPYNRLSWVCPEVERRYGNAPCVQIYGDATSKKDDVKVEKGQNLFTLIMDYFKDMHPELRVPDSNPNNKMRGNFINAIFALNFEGIEIIISPKCKKFIEDLANCQEDPNGKGKYKATSTVKGVRAVQKYGHFGDCMDYFMCMYFSIEYAMFQTGSMSFAPKGGVRIVKNSVEGTTEMEKMSSRLVKLGYDKVRTNAYIDVFEEEGAERKRRWDGKRKRSRNGYN